MATSPIFDTLDDIFLPIAGGSSTFDAGVTAGSIAEAKRISASTSQKAYRKLIASSNATSYSKLGQLHTCPRLYELNQLEASSPNASSVAEVEPINLHFCFGHAVGAGIQTYACTRSLIAAQFAAFISWKAPWDSELLDKKGNSRGKSLTWTELAVEKFGYFYETNLSDFDIVVLPNGRPAVELAFAVDMGNGFYHFGHIDAVLRSKSTGKLAVWEGKTSGFPETDEAIYANSGQALGYSVVVDAIAQQIGANGGDYEVLYIVYSSATREFTLLPFGKSRTQRAEWLQDLLLDHASVAKYQELNFYPKRGESCYSYSFRSRCKWFGQCTMHNSSLFPGTTPRKITSLEEVEDVDFRFTLAELIAAQQEKLS